MSLRLPSLLLSSRPASSGALPRRRSADRLRSILGRAPSPAAALLYVAATALATPVLTSPVLATIVLTLGSQSARAESAGDLDGLRVGEMRRLVLAAQPIVAPDTPYTGDDGAETTLAASNGQVRVVNFWATWCVPCRTEMPELEALARDAPSGVAVITIATGRNTPDGIARFRQETGITALPNALDPKGTLARAMDVPGLPATIVLDKDGVEVGRMLGAANWNSPEARALLGHIAGAAQG